MINMSTTRVEEEWEAKRVLETKGVQLTGITIVYEICPLSDRMCWGGRRASESSCSVECRDVQKFELALALLAWRCVSIAAW
jgi:hypothetical protein